MKHKRVLNFLMKTFYVFFTPFHNCVGGLEKLLTFLYFLPLGQAWIGAIEMRSFQLLLIQTRDLQ